jgi:hypothetical protein
VPKDVPADKVFVPHAQNSITVRFTRPSELRAVGLSEDVIDALPDVMKRIGFADDLDTIEVHQAISVHTNHMDIPQIVRAHPDYYVSYIPKTQIRVIFPLIFPNGA